MEKVTSEGPDRRERRVETRDVQRAAVIAAPTLATIDVAFASQFALFAI